jgi:serine/threonine protein kinase
MEMITGDAPFGDSDTMSRFEIFTNIADKTLFYPLTMSFSLKSLLKGLLSRDPRNRFNFSTVASSPWLKNVSYCFCDLLF